MLTKKRETSIVNADALLPTKFGEFRIRAFHDPNNNKEHALLYLEDPTKTPLVRVHSECLTGDAFGSLRCDCGPQLEASMKEIQEHGSGAIVYLKQEGRGIGLYAKMQAYALQDKGLDTLDANLQLGLPADARTYEMAAKMLKSIGYDELFLMTNNPEKRLQLLENGIDVKDRVPILIVPSEHNLSYLRTKASRMGHLLEV
ncbi:MAG: GTP cyclohydrolase II [Candidatus Poseidoniaceae archaeon]